MAQKSNFEKHCYASYSFDFRDTSRNFLQVKRGPKFGFPALGREWGLETVIQALCKECAKSCGKCEDKPDDEASIQNSSVNARTSVPDWDLLANIAPTVTDGTLP